MEGQLPFALASERLGVACGEIRLNRQSPLVYAYRYPGYFLNLCDLAAALRGLLAAGLTTTRCLERYLPLGTTLEQLLSFSPRPACFGRLGHRLTADGPIPDCSLTGEELRAILDEQVGDGPTLRLAAPAELSPALDAAIAAYADSGMDMAA